MSCKNDAARTPPRARAPEMMIAKKNHLPLIHRLRKAPLASVTNARKS